MFGADTNIVPNDVGADTTGESDVFSNTLGAAGDAAAAIISAINQPQINAQNRVAQQNTNTNLLVIAGVVLVLFLIFR